MQTGKNKWIWICGLLAAAVLMLGLYIGFKPKPSAGSKHITIEVVDDQGGTKDYELATDAEFLRGAMDELSASGDFSYEGADTNGFFYVTTINGLTADFDKDGSFWSIYVNGEYGMYGVDEQTVSDQDSFRFAYEK